MPSVSLDFLTPAAIVAIDRAALAARLLPWAAHRVNNALQVISGTVEQLEEQGHPVGPDAEALQIVREEALTAAQALERVVEFARPAAAAARARVDLAGVVAEAVLMQRFSAQRTGFTIRFLEPSAPVIVEGVSAQLHQAALDLLAHAQATATPPAAIVVELHERDGWAVIRVHGEKAGDETPGPERKPRDAGSEGLIALGLVAAGIVAQEHGGSFALDQTSDGPSLTLRLPATSAARACAG